MPITRVGFIGLGIMGRPMARCLLRAGFKLTVHSRSRGPVDEIVAEGATAAFTAAEVARASEVTITMLPDSPDVETVALGPGGVLEGASSGGYYIDMSTIAPALSRRIAAAGRERGVGCLDAPVSGSDIAAKDGALSIMVGGSTADFDVVKPVLAALGRTIVHAGPPGMGATFKLCNQVAGQGTLMMVCEALTLAARAGADLEVVIQALAGGAARSWMVENLGPKIAARDFAPGFMVRLAQKDIRLVQELAAETGTPLEGIDLLQRLYSDVSAHGGANLGIQAVAAAVERRSESPPA